MAREKMVTRTIEGTNATYTALNIETNEVVFGTAILQGKYTDCNEALKQLKKDEVAGQSIIIVTVTSVETFERLFGMSESLFMEQAKELDPTTRKPL